MEIAISRDVDADAVGGARVFPDRPQVEPGTRAEQVPRGDGARHPRQVREDVLVEQDRADDRRVLQTQDVQVGELHG
jgi:hypothetical protein